MHKILGAELSKSTAENCGATYPTQLLLLQQQRGEKSSKTFSISNQFSIVASKVSSSNHRTKHSFAL
jgi:hypothetical protein